MAFDGFGRHAPAAGAARGVAIEQRAAIVGARDLLGRHRSDVGAPVDMVARLGGIGQETPVEDVAGMAGVGPGDGEALDERIAGGDLGVRRT